MNKLSGTLWACLLLASVAIADTYKAISGDSLERIAHKYGVSTQKIKDLNPGLSDDKLKVGMSVQVPGSSSSKAKVPTNGQYFVRNGETTASIAKLYGVSEGALKKLNEGAKIKKGAFINVPFKDVSAKDLRAQKLAKAQAKAPKKGGLHVVAEGDNDWTIAAKYKISARQLKELNPGVDFDKLKIGANLNVPGPVKVAVTTPKPEPKKAELEAPIALAQQPSKASFALAEPVKPKPVAKASAIDGRSARVKGEDVNMRSRPNTSASRVAQVDKGDLGKVLDQQNGWVKLQMSDGSKGWIRADFLASSNETVKIAAKPKLPEVRGGGGESSTGIFRTAYSYVGTRYVYGGTSRGGIDCSGFVGAVFRANGINLPRTAAEQSGMGRYVSRSDLRRGDLLFFRTGRSSRINHVGLYLGDGKFIHASSGAGRVQVESINKAYYVSHYATARRIRDFGGKISFDSSSTVDEEPEIRLPDVDVPETPVRQGEDPIGH